MAYSYLMRRKHTETKVAKNKKSKYNVTRTDTQRFTLLDGEVVKLTNDSGEALLVTVFPAVHHE